MGSGPHARTRPGQRVAAGSTTSTGAPFAPIDAAAAVAVRSRMSSPGTCGGVPGCDHAPALEFAVRGGDLALGARPVSGVERGEQLAHPIGGTVDDDGCLASEVGPERPEPLVLPAAVGAGHPASHGDGPDREPGLRRPARPRRLRTTPRCRARRRPRSTRRRASRRRGPRAPRRPRRHPTSVARRPGAAGASPPSRRRPRASAATIHGSAASRSNSARLKTAANAPAAATSEASSETVRHPERWSPAAAPGSTVRSSAMRRVRMARISSTASEASASTRRR